MTVKPSQLKKHLLENYNHFFKPESIRASVINIWEDELDSSSSDAEEIYIKSRNKVENSPRKKEAYRSSKPDMKLLFESNQNKEVQKAHTPRLYYHEKRAPATKSKEPLTKGYSEPQMYFNNEEKSRINSSYKFNSLRDYRISTEVEQKLETDDEENPNAKRSYQRHITVESNSNMFHWGDSRTSNEFDDRMCPELELKFGFHLIQYFNNYFGCPSKYDRYQCDPKRWRIKRLLQNYPNYEPSDIEDRSTVEKSLENAFKKSMRIFEAKKDYKDEETYLKAIVSSNIDLKELWDFYNKQYYSEGKEY